MLGAFAFGACGDAPGDSKQSRAATTPVEGATVVSTPRAAAQATQTPTPAPVDVVLPAAASPRSCGQLTVGSYFLRVTAISGTTCRRARRIVREYMESYPSHPWDCLAGSGERYKAHPVVVRCGYKGHGDLAQRPHALIAVDGERVP